MVTGYILYSRHVRRQVVQNNPESNFGEISRLVGNEWRSLPASEKQAWEEKASKLNEETKALLLDEPCASPAPAPTPHPDQVSCVCSSVLTCPEIFLEFRFDSLLLSFI